MNDPTGQLDEIIGSINAAIDNYNSQIESIIGSSNNSSSSDNNNSGYNNNPVGTAGYDTSGNTSYPDNGIPSDYDTGNVFNFDNFDFSGVAGGFGNLFG